PIFLNSFPPRRSSDLLLQIALIASRGDALGDIGATWALELLELLGQAVIRILGEPGAIRLAAQGITPVVVGGVLGREPHNANHGPHGAHAPPARVMMEPVRYRGRKSIHRAPWHVMTARGERTNRRPQPCTG